MGVDVAHLLGLDARVLERGAHAALRTLTIRRNTGHVIGIGAHAVANHLGQNLCTPSLCKLEFFKDENACALTDHETVAILVERTACLSGLILARRKRTH